MATKTETFLVDDLDGSEAKATIEFAVDGRAYSIDLSEENAQRFRDAVAEFVEAARKAKGKGGTSGNRRTRHNLETDGTVTPIADNPSIRAWARANGHEVSDRGRISKELLAAFQAAQGLGQAS